MAPLDFAQQACIAYPGAFDGEACKGSCTWSMMPCYGSPHMWHPQAWPYPEQGQYFVNMWPAQAHYADVSKVTQETDAQRYSGNMLPPQAKHADLSKASVESRMRMYVESRNKVSMQNRSHAQLPYVEPLKKKQSFLRSLCKKPSLFRT